MCFTVTFTKIISPSKWRMGVCVSGQKITTEFLRVLVSRKGMLFQLVAAGLNSHQKPSDELLLFHF